MIKYFARYFKNKRSQKNDQKAIDKLTAVDNLIRDKYLMIDTPNYIVAMLDNLWSMYEGDRLIAFCENLKYYCDIQNAYHNKKVDKKARLVISLKYEDDTVKPYAYFDGKEVILFESKK